jgi:hypothetical protein
MINGISLKRYQRMLDQGESYKFNFIELKLLSKVSNRVFNTQNILEMKYCDFVDLENCIEENNYIKFCCIFVKKYFWQSVYYHNLKPIIEDFAKQKEELKEKYYYIFDPPTYGEPAPETMGSEVRKDFVQEFGNWVIIMDKACKGKIVDYKIVEQWKLEEVLFWVNYLEGQRITENVK